MIQMAVLGSGSSGNATLIQCGSTRILVDAGLSAKQLTLRLEALGVSADDLDGILITHEHSDHARGIDVLLRKRRIPVYANLFTREALEHQMKSDISWKVFRNGQPFELGDFNINAFTIPHDAADPVGFTIQSSKTKLSMISDAGHVTKLMKENLRGSHGIYIEANYDIALLDRDIKRPWSTKQRIASRHGHLSNEQTAEFLEEIACEKLKQVVLCHLSSDCNCPKIAVETITKVFEKRNLPQVNIHCSQQDQVTPWIQIA